MTAWLAHVLGLDNLSGPYYGFWSGIGSDISELALFGALMGLLRKHNCHIRGCWRLGRHPIGGTTWVVCARHHPAGAPRRSDVIEAVRRADAASASGGDPRGWTRPSP